MLNALATLPAAATAALTITPGDPVAAAAPAAPSLAELHRRWAALYDEIEAIGFEVDEVMMTHEHPTWPYMPIEDERLFPEQIETELTGLGRQHANGELLWHCDRLRRRLADMAAKPEKYGPLREAAQERYRVREDAFYSKADQHGLTPRIERQRAARAELEQVYDAIWETPPATIADVAAFLDIAIERHDEVPTPDERMWDEWPWMLRLMQKLRTVAPGVEFTWLRRLSPPGHDLIAEMLDDAPPEPDALIAAE